MTAGELVPGLNEWLKSHGVAACVTVKGKDVLEVRIESEDLIASMFSVGRPTVRTHVTIHKDCTYAPKKEASAPVRKGFDLHTVSAKGQFTDTELSRLQGFTRAYPFLSATKADSKVWENTCREVVWLAEGLFTDMHMWDNAWLGKTLERGGGPSLLKGRFRGIPSVLDAIEKCLDFVESAHRDGGYWYPPLENGKIPRRPLATFLVSRMRNGREWSPFCEVLWDMERDTAIKGTLPSQAVEVAESIVKESEYIRTSGRLDAYWTGVKKFVDWYTVHRDSLMGEVDNRVRLADVGAAITLVREWNASVGYRVLPVAFVYPGSDRWFRFAQWCTTNRGVVIPEYRKLR